MGFINHHQCVLRQVFKQRRWWLTRCPARQEAGIIFNPGTVAQFLHHFDIETGTLTQALMLQQLAFFGKMLEPIAQLQLDVFNGIKHCFSRCYIMGFRINCIAG